MSSRPVRLIVELIVKYEPKMKTKLPELMICGILWRQSKATKAFDFVANTTPRRKLIDSAHNAAADTLPTVLVIERELSLATNTLRCVRYSIS